MRRHGRALTLRKREVEIIIACCMFEACTKRKFIQGAQVVASLRGVPMLLTGLKNGRPMVHALLPDERFNEFRMTVEDARKMNAGMLRYDPGIFGTGTIP